MAIKNYFRSTGSWAKHAAILAVLGAMGALLGSCGGGGVAGTTATGGALQVQPASADVFPDVSTVFSVSGGKSPYDVSTSNNVVIPPPTISGTTFTVIARPVVADTVVTLTIRDSAGLTTTTALNVKATTLSNVVTITPIAPTGTGCGGLCSGGDAQVTVTAALNGVKLVNRPIRFDVFQGDFRFVTPGTNVQVTSIIINTDENGIAVARLQAIVTAPTQVAILTTTDTSTGLVRRTNFVIVQQTSGTGILSSLPSGTTTFTGGKPGVGQPAQCPFGGIVDYYIYGGTPPYVIVSPLPQFLTVTPAIVNTNGGSFRVTQNGCGTSQLIVTDAQNRFIETSQVIGALGPAGDAPPPPVANTFTASPTVVSLACGASAAISLSGTAGTYTAAVTTPGVPVGAFSIIPSTGPVPGTVSLQRNNVGNGSPTSIIVTFVAGSISQAVTVSVPANCP